MKIAKTVAVYGSNGYTGGLVIAELVRRGHVPVLCGRNRDELQRVNERFGGTHRVEAADVADRKALDAMLEGVDTVLNCAGPLTLTSFALAEAAIRNKVHYLDTNAAEQLAAKRLFDELSASAQDAGVVVVPVMGILGGLGDMLAHIASAGLPSLDAISVAYAIKGWIPTRGSQATATSMQPAVRLRYRNGAFSEIAPKLEIVDFDFGEELGLQKAIEEFPGAEVATIPRHVRSCSIVVKMAAFTMQEFRAADADWAASVGADQRAKNDFTVIVESHARAERTRIKATGTDIYGITAPFMIDAAESISTEKIGVLSPTEAFEPASFLGNFKSHAFKFGAVAV